MGISFTGAILETLILSEMLELSGGSFEKTVHKVYTENDFKELVKKNGFGWEASSFWFGLDQLLDPMRRIWNGGAGLIKLKEDAYIWATSMEGEERVIHTPNISVYNLNIFFRNATCHLEEAHFDKGFGAIYLKAVAVWEAAHGRNYKEYEAEVLERERISRESWAKSKESGTWQYRSDDF